MEKLNLIVEVAPLYSYAFHHNQLPLISRLQLNYPVTATAEHKTQLQVVLTPQPSIFAPVTWRIDSLASGESLSLPQQQLALSSDYLDTLSESVQVSLQFEIFEHDTLISSTQAQTCMQPKNFWGGEVNMAELLPAFVTPNASYVEQLVKQASDLLKQSRHGSKLDGYQSATRERPYLMAMAIWNVIAAAGIAYVIPPASFAKRGQRIRLPEDIESSKTAACLDLSTLFAACFEHAGLNSIIAVTEGHACCGVWLIDECFSLLTNDDPMDLRKRLAAKDIVLFETTLATSDSHVSFADAIESAERLLSEQSEENFVYAIDIRQARHRNIRPLPSRRSQANAAGEQPIEPIDILIAPMSAPVLPPVSLNELPTPDTPDGRVEMWQRKLLDLSKRNRLLNLSPRSVMVRVFCPDVAKLEDLLADGQIFNFITPTDTPLYDSTRDPELYRFTFGNEQINTFAKAQLDNKVIIANESGHKLESSLLNLYRKAKQDLEEGGANTLYLAIGMLKWKEASSQMQTYRAPLILLPVELLRSSARAKIRLKQRLDSEVTFNSTLIEFLKNDLEIDLSSLNQALPEDESGVDVPRVFAYIRDKIKDSAGFELVEELVISNFSFSKYLMWEDLKNRVADLKANAFVKHLIESPQLPYPQTPQFLDLKDIDQQLKPCDIYAPLNADSSQLIAIDASTRAQDFVLEGPPGTGKSETIANIIAHNLAKGRKVLFVAEKMAALNVVYRRLEKAGLDHLCLELHSNKTNKRVILDQLKSAWTQRSNADQQQWQNSAQQLFDLRSKLNHYVNELHQPSEFGISPRQAIARVCLQGQTSPLRLNWPTNLSDAPIQNQQQLEQVYQIGKDISLAYADISGLYVDGKYPQGLSLINQTQWSNAWQSQLISLAKQLQNQVTDTQQAYLQLQQTVPIFSAELTLAGVELVADIARQITGSAQHLYAWALTSDAKSMLAALEELANEQHSLQDLLSQNRVTITPVQTLSLPLTQWISELNQANQQFFVLAWFSKRTLKQAFVANGLTAQLTLADLEWLRAIQLVAERVQTLAAPFKQERIWLDWQTSAAQLQAHHTSANQLFVSSRAFAASTPAPAQWLASLKNYLIEQHEFLSDSAAPIQASNHFIDQAEQFNTLLAQFHDQGADAIEPSQTLLELAPCLTDLIQSETKLNAWCNWQQAQQLANQHALTPLISALQHGDIDAASVPEQLTTAVCHWLAPILIDRSDALRTFRSSSHEALIAQFSELDAKVASTTADFIAARHAANTPDPNSPDSPEGYGVLAREFNRKSGHKPIRQLIQEMGDNVLQLTPCMMMSPLSVAQFLPADFNAFDLVVFDEASQITVWDAVGCIARGKNVVVVGDPKQMPPTNFFNKADIEDEAADEADLESILDQALSARLPHHRLTGHYRSKHESLIAFSNAHYYESALTTFPSAETKESAVNMHRVAGIYGKGTERNNPIEAQAVADYIVSRLMDKKRNHLSIGVVTLNTEQQRCIEDCLETHRRNNQQLERFFHATNRYDPVFVKNLESVQGDERDIIIFSLGYGPTELDASRISMNFGPLNKQGGERRLNVAVTRSTTEMHVFSSFDSNMIDLSRTSSMAVRHLKNFLEYAERGPIALADKAHVSGEPSRFNLDLEQAIASRLREKGWQVKTNIGVSKLRIDLAIIHPDHPDTYLAGIECDGVTYQRAPAARDRDRVRKIILTLLGWHIVRVWSTDYFIDAERVIDQLHQQLEDRLSQSRSAHEEEVIEAPELIEPVTIARDELDPTRYFDADYAFTLNHLAKEVLQTKNGISLAELVADIGWQHNLARTTQKQLDHIETIIAPWAGIATHADGSKTAWATPDDVCDAISWRGVTAFGLPRDWSSLPYPERIGLAQYALAKDPDDAVGVIFAEFNLGRRTASTKREFESWLALAQ